MNGSSTNNSVTTIHSHLGRTMNGSSLIIKLKRSSSPLGACSCSTIEDKNLIKGKKKKKEKKKARTTFRSTFIRLRSLLCSKVLIKVESESRLFAAACVS